MDLDRASGVAAGVLIAGWRGARWWRRGVSALALPLCVLCSALALNLWVGYFPTVQTAWNQLTAGPLPDQTDAVTVTAMQKRHAIPPKGTVVPVSISDAASGFKHRGELVYLPPAWYATDPPPPLPTVMMIGGEFNTPADWMRAGNAMKTIDEFASAHGGNAPVFVFVDPGGAFNNDTECVNGARGNAADHLTKDVVPFMVSNYRRVAEPCQLGRRRMVDGRHLRRRPGRDASRHVQRIRGHRGRPDPQFGQQGPDHRAAVRRQQPPPMRRSTRRRSSPATAPTPGWRAGSTSTARTPSGTNAVNAAANPNDQTAAANSLCATGSANGIRCAVVAQPGKHDWPFAARAFAAALPWLAGQLGTPGLPALPLPASPPSVRRSRRPLRRTPRRICRPPPSRPVA